MSWVDFWKDLDRRAAEESGKSPPQYAGGGECAETGKTISRDRARTIQAQLRIQRGFHPFGFRLREPSGETCGTCAHLEWKETGSRRTFFKCGLRGDTNGPGTDCRKKWPACERWKADE